jgi:hypothetical protein
MRARWLWAIPALFMVGATVEASQGTAGGDLEPAERITFACPVTTWSSWDTIPACDLDGSQTWILADEMTDLNTDAIELQDFCWSMGGVYAENGWDPMTAYCIDVDY